ncbi:GNAT family protein [Microbacterium sp. KR10-403]|uniref:GNAT family N-acetyltransferase n=1 Tax=Microbacterium sp. KR10-403 TaxID=3158581 RepID=UPI0032E503C4
MRAATTEPGRGVDADGAPSLRRLCPDDAPAVLAAFESNEDMARQGDVSSLADAEAYVARLAAAGSPHEAWVVAAGDKLVGLVCVTVDEKNRNGWFWYWMTDAARGRGWTSRAAATVADWALTVRGLERLELGHRVNNPASGAIARHAGFVREGTERAKFLVDGRRVDVDTYGRLRSDPTPAYESLRMVV